MSDHLLELDEVAVAYDGRTVLEVPHLTVSRGEVLTLLGENGSGKTTLLRLLGLLTTPHRGRVIFDGEEVDFGGVRRPLALRRRMAAVMQEPLLCRMTVRRNVALGLRFRRMPRSEVDRRVDHWLQKLSIAHLAQRPAAKLSGGEAQRTSLARAMVLRPEVLFMDEPFAALDAPTRQGLLEEFRAVLAESGVTAVFATHDRGEALALGHRVAVLMGGRVVQLGSTEDVFARPDHADVARFVGVDTLIPGRVSGTVNGLVRVRCGEVLPEGEISVGAEGTWVEGDAVYVALRPEEVQLREPDGSESVGAGNQRGDEVNVLAGRITKTVPVETHHRVEVDCRLPVVAAVGRALFRDMALEVGRPVEATFRAGSAHLIRRSTD
jgi:tungstate transport system ATP-binding protein